MEEDKQIADANERIKNIDTTLRKMEIQFPALINTRKKHESEPLEDRWYFSSSFWDKTYKTYSNTPTTSYQQAETREDKPASDQDIINYVRTLAKKAMNEDIIEIHKRLASYEQKQREENLSGKKDTASTSKKSFTK